MSEDVLEQICVKEGPETVVFMAEIKGCTNCLIRFDYDTIKLNFCYEAIVE